MISKEIDGKNIGLGEAKIENWKVTPINDEYCAFSLFLRISNATVKEIG